MTTKIQILSNTSFPLVEVIKNEIMESAKINIAVAFLRKSGMDQILKAMDHALTQRNAEIEIIVGLDFKHTDHVALRTLEQLSHKYSRFSFYCFGDRRDNFNDLVFHPKIYLFSERNRYTSIVGSSNLTRGGLLSNFEINVVFRENKPVYYAQLGALYNEIKFTDSVFVPSEDYLEKYAAVRADADKSGNEIGSSLRKRLQALKKEEDTLPGPGTTLKRVIIDIIKKKHEEGIQSVGLRTIYQESERVVHDKKLHFQMDTFRNSIRGELNKHEQNSKHPDSRSLFVRSSPGKYSLTDIGEGYEGR